MISEKNLKEIADIFIGDIIGLYPYKRGEDIVGFFNERFGYRDTYGAGVSSRWILVRDKIVDMIDKGTINYFFDLVLSVDYIRSETGLSLVESAERAEECYQRFKEIVNRDSYDIISKEDKYFFIETSEDLELIGKGGFANVYLQKSTGKVIKQLKPFYLKDKAIRSRFKREYEITQELSDVDGIIKVFDYNTDNCSYTMEKADTTLEKYINSNQLSDTIKINLIRQMLTTMAEVHKRKIIHRDLSPNNIFLKNGELIISDFGLGKDYNTIHSHQTEYTNELGKYDYCAPEQLRELKKGDERSDVYSLGKIVSFVMTGNPNENHHVLRGLVIEATKDEYSSRFENAQSMLDRFDLIVDSIESKERQNELNQKIKNRIFDNEVESFIDSLSRDEITTRIISHSSGFSEALIKYMLIDDTKAEYIIESINDSYKDTCTDFQDFDPIATFSNQILNNNNLSAAHDIAAGILSYIAYDVNRFYAQRLISDLDKRITEPYLKEILHGYED